MSSKQGNWTDEELLALANQTFDEAKPPEARFAAPQTLAGTLGDREKDWTAEIVDEPADDETSGIWRYERYLVVDQQQHNFPDRCIWTNDEVGDARQNTELVAEDPGRWQYSIYYGVGLGQRIHRLKLQLPSSPRWSQPVAEAKRRIGKKIFRTSAVVAAVSLLASVAFIFSEPPPTNTAVLIGVLVSFPFVFGMIGTVVGFAWPYLEGTPGPGAAIPVKRTGERFLWIEGVSPAFLADLPEWPNGSFESLFKRPQTLTQYLSANWPFLILMAILAVIAIAIRVIIKLALRGELAR